MTLRNFIEAVAMKLLQKWPDREVYVHEIPQGVDGKHFIRLVSSQERRGLDRRYIREMSFEIIYFQKDKDTLDYLDWADTLYDEMEVLEVKEDDVVTRRIKTHGWETRNNGDQRFYSFLFDVTFNYVVTGDPIPTMYALEHLPRLKEVT